MNKRQTGSAYEQTAAAFLTGEGYRILEKNYRCRAGEIDLIAKNDGYLVFVEVKYRRDDRKGEPQEAVTPLKQQRIMRTAQYYMVEQNRPEDTPCRFDVIAVFGEEIRHFVNAFGGL